jgi:hypothetical protein
MPVSRTVNGLLLELTCDSYVDEGWGLHPGTFTHTDDTTDKQEGAAAQKVHTLQGYYPSGSQEGYLDNVAGSIDPFAAGNRLHIWHKCTLGPGATSTWALKIFKDPPVFDWVAIITKSGAEAWTLKKVDMPSGVTWYPYLRSDYIISGNYEVHSDDWIDHLVISTTRYLTVTGLTPGQKVKIYRSSDNALLDTQTCAGGATQIVSDIDAQDYPLYLYFKVYATDGTTLIETTPSYRMGGGDTWAWVAPTGTLSVTSTAFIIIRAAGVGTPKSATITATLLTPAGAPYPGVTIYFTTSRGTCTPASAVTDVNGQVSTVLTSTTHGFAVVKCNWPGDASVPAAVGFMTHHVFYDAEVGDVTKKFQLYIEGVELAYSDGSYMLSSSTDPQEWSAVIPEWQTTIIKRGLVSIYRKGIKEFSGVLLKPSRLMSENSRVVLGGIDSKALLGDRVVPLKDYSAKTLSYILSDLLTSYSCGISVGSLGTYPTTLSITFADQSLVDAVAHLCDVIGWLYRITSANGLDIKPSFGMSRSIVFEEGVNLFQGENDEDYTQLSNSIRMRGNEDLVSTQVNSSSIEAIGLVEAVAFEKSIAVQATLDLAAVAELDRRVNSAARISGRVLDTNAVGSWGIDDWITLTCAENELSGTYKVVNIRRDMKDPNYAEVEFQNPSAVRIADIIESIRKKLKDLNAKTAI